MLLSAIFWLSITLNKTYSTSYSLYVRLLGQVYPVQVEAKGTGWTLLRLSLRPPRDTIALSVPSNVDILQTRRLLPNIKQVFPDNVDISIISPDSLVLREFPRVATKKITLFAPVEQIEELLCDSCYISTPVSIVPSQLIVEGENDKLNLLPDTLVLPVYGRSIRDHFDITYRSSQLISQKNIQVKPPTVRLHFRVGYLQQTTLEVPVELKDFPEKGHWQIQPSRVKVQVRGKPDDLAKIKETGEGIRAWVSFAETGPNDSLRVRASTLIEGIKIKTITPPQVKLLHP